MGGGGRAGRDAWTVIEANWRIVSHRSESELHLPVPTTRPRHYVTETDDLAAALDAAALRWPELSRSQLLVRLALSAGEAERMAETERRDRRLATLERLSREGIP